MIVRVPVGSLRLGMFVRDPQKRWSDNGDGFVIKSDQELARITATSTGHVLVDTARAEPVPPTPPGQKQARTRRVDDLDRKRAAKTIETSRKAVARMADDIRLGRPLQIMQLAPLVAELSEEVKMNGDALFSLLRIKRRDQYTYLHSVAVAALMINLARAAGEEEADLSAFGMAGLLHDAGKIAVPGAILNKPGRLTDAEFDIMRSHPARGHRILEQSAGISSLARDVCLNHHERPDASGYPEGLSGGALSRAARMAAICDVYDALTSNRAYKDAWTPQRALSAMQEWTGQFDPELLFAFIGSLGIYPVGSLVRIRESALAIVIEDNLEEPTCPTVRSFYSITRGSHGHCEDVRIRVPSVLTLEAPAAWGFDDWPKLTMELRAARTNHIAQQKVEPS